MSNEVEIEAKFWKALKSDMTVMLGLTGVDEDHRIAIMIFAAAHAQRREAERPHAFANRFLDNSNDFSTDSVDFVRHLYPTKEKTH